MRIITVCIAVATSLLGMRGLAQDAESPIQSAEQRMEFMQAQAEAFEGKIGDTVKIQAFEKPLLRWSNPQTNILDGVLVCWVDQAGAPAATAQICLTPNSLDQWAIELQSLAQQPISLSNGVIETWEPSDAGVIWRPLKDAPDPAVDQQRRLVQMRAAARRFRGDDDFENSESVLRLMTNPLLRYSNPDAGITDGAMFALVHGTDPELLILIESRRDGQGASQYYWALAPVTSFELRGYLDGKEVWHKPAMTSNLPTDVFFQRLLVPGTEPERTLSDRVRDLLGL